MKKIVSVLVILSLVLVMTACGGTAATTTAAATTTKAPGTTAATSAGSTTAAATTAAKSKYDSLDKIYIGCILPLTGAGGATGKFVQTASDMWVEEVNAAGGILGKKVQMVYEDTQSTDQGAANAYHKIAARGDISASMGGQYSNQGLAALPFVKQYKIPTIHHGSSVKLTAAVTENPYTWQNRINDKGTGYSMADAIVNTLKAKKIAVIHDTDAFGQGLADNAIAAMKTFGVEPALVLKFTIGEKQFAGYLGQIKQAGCDGILMMAHPNEAALIQMGIKGAGLESLIKVGSPDAGASTTIALSQDACNGWYSISDWVPSIETEPGKSFAKKYQDKFGVVSDMNSSSAYDILTIFKAAIEKAKSQDPEAINNALGKLGEVQGVASLYSFNAEHIGATTQFLAINENKIPKVMAKITRADYKK